MVIMNNELQDKVEELEQTINKLSSKLDAQSSKFNEFKSKINIDNLLNVGLDVSSKDTINDVVSKSIEHTMWNNIFYLSSFATASVTTTTTELLDANGRESDTSAGKRFQTTIPSRFKVAFYLNADIATSTIYITSPAISTVAAIGTSIIDANKSYVGVKFVAGDMSIVSNISGTEKTIATSITITDNTTHILEILYNVSNADVYFNNTLIGTIACDLVSVGVFETFFPFLTSVGSNNGTSVNLTIESFEFLQKRK